MGDAKINPDLEPLARPLGDLHCDPKNARKHGKRDLDTIAKSLDLHGQQKPIVVMRDGKVIAGNGTLEAARALGWDRIACVTYDDEDAAKAAAFAIVDNRSAELSEWDTDELGRLLAELPPALQADVGWTPAELASLLPRVGEVDEPPPVRPNAVSKRGEVFELGPHRLMCGDSTSAKDVCRLMNGERALLCATDPPYLVDYDGTNHPQSFGRERAGKDNNKHWDAYRDPPASVEFFSRFIQVAIEHALVKNPALYQWHASSRQALVEAAWTANQLLLHQQLIWVKNRSILTHCHFMWRHEPCFYGWIQGRPPELRPPVSGECSTIWTIDQKGEYTEGHPTIKPLEIFERPISYHTRAGDLVYEPFSGSGTQLIAAAKLGRKCFAMELAPTFVDVARRRWTSWARNAGVDPGPGALV